MGEIEEFWLIALGERNWVKAGKYFKEWLAGLLLGSLGLWCAVYREGSRTRGQRAVLCASGVWMGSHEPGSDLSPENMTSRHRCVALEWYS